MVVAGVMSGTSADGVDVALVRFSAAREGAAPKMTLVGHVAVPYAKALRTAIMNAMDASAIAVAELARLSWRLGEIYGDAIVQAQAELGVKADLVGVHGQTMYHQGAPAKYMGAALRCTWQMGEAAEVAARTRLPVVSDFRTRDIVAGGQGAPLVPIFDRMMFAHATRNRVLQNLGGIANMTALPAGSGAVMAFDSGPAGMVIDGCMTSLFGKKLDRNGAVARRGVPVREVLDALMHAPYFSLQPPKSSGREEFGTAYVSHLIALCRRHKAGDADIVATATALTAESVLKAYREFVWPFLGQRAPLAKSTEYVVAGGGARNATLMQQLRAGLEPLGVRVRTIEEFGVPTEAKEAMAFALLAWLRWHELPGNIPAATGASREVMLGKVTLP